MSFNMFDFLNKLSFTRVSGSNEELKATKMIKEQVNSFGLNADILDFEVSGYNVTKATLSSNEKQYEVSGIKGCKSFKVTCIEMLSKEELAMLFNKDISGFAITDENLANKFKENSQIYLEKSKL